MKKNNLFIGIMYIFGGAVLLFLVLLTDSIIENLLIGFASGGICAGIAMICRYFYWSRPENRERYQEKMANENIEIHDELKIKLRDKSGKYAYVLGLVAVSISIVIFSILGELEIVDNSRVIILYLGGYLVFQIITGIVIFNYLLKKY